jgi:glycosyltransferase involved in cell wall biosynthesis
MNHPMVSVIMPVFNEERYVQAAIESILDQTFESLELLIIDDYSTDTSFRLCEAYARKDPRVRLYRKIAEPKGVSSSRNIAVRMAIGDYILLQDADDVSRKDRIEKQLAAALDGTGNMVIGCLANRIENGTSRILNVPEQHNEIIKGFQRVRKRVTIISGTALAPRQVLLRFPQRLKFRYMQDWDQMLRMFESGEVKFYNCQEPLYTYFIRGKGTIFQREWIDYNIFVRNCQFRRNKGLGEFDSINEFQRHIARHLLEWSRWKAIKSLVGLQLKIIRMRAAWRSLHK